MTEIAKRLRAAIVAPVIRTATEKSARRAVEVLTSEGFTLFELTLTTPGALDIVRDLAKLPDITVGLGTILTCDQGEAAIAAGAEFAVSPAFVPGLTEVCRASGTPVALGAATPTEALRAHEEGADFVKIFPAYQLGGAGFVKALKSVYPMIEIMPTGGINPSDVKGYVSAGAACLGMGGNLVNDSALAEGRDDVIRDAARAVRAEISALSEGS